MLTQTGETAALIILTTVATPTATFSMRGAEDAFRYHEPIILKFLNENCCWINLRSKTESCRTRLKNQINKAVEVVGYSSKSMVPDTPYDKQTFDGARNRALGCKSTQKGDYFIGLESGLVERYGQLYEEAWVCILMADEKEFYGYSSGLKLPNFVLEKMDKMKMEHSDAMTMIEEEFGKIPNDTWGTYSGGVLIREVSLEEALRNALIQSLPHKDSLYLK